MEFEGFVIGSQDLTDRVLPASDIVSGLLRQLWSFLFVTDVDNRKTIHIFLEVRKDLFSCSVSGFMRLKELALSSNCLSVDARDQFPIHTTVTQTTVHSLILFFRCYIFGIEPFFLYTTLILSGWRVRLWASLFVLAFRVNVANVWHIELAICVLTCDITRHRSLCLVW